MKRWRQTCAAAAALLAFGAGAQAASDLELPLEDYMKSAGPEVKLIEPGELKIDGQSMTCGRRPTVMDPKFDSWGGAYEGYLILNPAKLQGLTTTIKLFVFSHECGHQFIGRDEEAADCFAIKRGRRYGWLDDGGLLEVCEFISKLKGDWDHPAGPKRCEHMRACYDAAAPSATR
ncbi:MAG: hypothetical protein VX871_10530 [Pseudomonadota bacterium]|nr:hypothetical protein [Pseudomonadota bacterium]